MFNRGFSYIFFSQQAIATDQAKVFAEWIAALPPEQRPKTAAYPALDDPFTGPVVEGAEKKQLLDTKAGGLFECALNLCTLRSNPKNRNNNGPANIFPQPINTAMDASERQLSKSDILFAWAHTLHREAAFREGWSASQTLQQAVEKAQASYELNPDTNNHYSPIFLLWHKILADQEKVLQK